MFQHTTLAAAALGILLFACGHAMAQAQGSEAESSKSAVVALIERLDAPAPMLRDTVAENKRIPHLNGFEVHGTRPLSRSLAPDWAGLDLASDDAVTMQSLRRQLA